MDLFFQPLCVPYIMVCTMADILLSCAVYLAAGGPYCPAFHFQTQAQMGAMRPTSEYCFQADYSWTIMLYYRCGTHRPPPPICA